MANEPDFEQTDTGSTISEPSDTPSETEHKGKQPSDERKTGEQVVVECEGVTKTYRKLFSSRETTAVKELDLSIYRGEVFGLLGPNGSGKTTTMKILLGLLFPDEGTARVLKRDPRHVATKERIGFLPEQTHLYDFLSGKETLEFYASLFGMSSANQARKVEELLKDVGLWEDRNRKLSEYSKGMSRRIGFAQALINDPQVVFLDEPTVGLDPIIARQLKNHILELRNRDKTIIVSSHVLADVEDICDRVAILHDGIKRKEGDVEDMLQIREQLNVMLESMDDTEEMKEQIKTVLDEKGWTLEGFSHPTRTLEDLFLSTIRQSD